MSLRDRWSPWFRPSGPAVVRVVDGKSDVWIGDYPAVTGEGPWQAETAADRINAAIEKWRPTEQTRWLVVLDALLESGGDCTPAVVALAGALGLKMDWCDIVKDASDDVIADEFYRRGLERGTALDSASQRFWGVATVWRG